MLELIERTDRAARLYNCTSVLQDFDDSDPENIGSVAPYMVTGDQWAVIEAMMRPEVGGEEKLRPVLERQIAVRAEDSDDDEDAERTYAFPPPVDLDAYAAACRLPPAEETEDEREARFQRERCFGL